MKNAKFKGKMTGKEMIKKLPSMKRWRKEIEPKSSSAYQRLIQIGSMYPTATFIFCSKHKKKAKLYEAYGGLVVYCNYKDDLKFYVILHKKHF